MLVLSRRKRQDIFVGDQIRITIVSIHGDTVRIGIEAPREVKIVREELLEESHLDNRPAA